MPSPLSVRRCRGFRPVVYSQRHREVARLLAQGKSRAAIAQETGYSVAHISRIAGMRQTRQHVASNFARLALRIITRSWNDEEFDERVLLVSYDWR
jgi:DNA-binding NarL/FixJ family response regulator